MAWLRSGRRPLGKGAPAWAALSLAGLAACGPDPSSGISDSTERLKVRVVEVLASPAPGGFAFVELRNDGKEPASTERWQLEAGGQKLDLSPFPLGPEEEGEGEFPAVPPHGLALVVDADAEPREVERVACESPIRTGRDSLGESERLILASLALQARRRCAPVLRAEGLGQALAGAEALALLRGASALDRVERPLGAGRGVALERTGTKPNALEPSPLGATPGARNFFGSDPGELGKNGEPPLVALVASPWRVGDAILALRREARHKREAALAEEERDASAAEALRKEAEALEARADAILAGDLPENPLDAPFEHLVEGASREVSGALFQLNVPGAVEALVDAKGRGAEVRLVSDAQFHGDPRYAPGLERLEQAGVPVAFDFGPDGKNRDALSHNKFLVVDRELVWTGSFNPIEDEPARIHADNALRVRSPELAELHAAEFETLFGGGFGTKKRGQGLGGGKAFVDGARLDVRFSPGLTADAVERRARALEETGDPAAACAAAIPSTGAPVVDPRFRELDPCGGPLDLILAETARATSSIYFVAFSLSLDDVAKVVSERIRGGVEVKGVVDPTVAGRDAPLAILKAGGDVRFTPNSDPECAPWVSPKSRCPRNPNKVWLHHKFILIDYGTDHPVVVTGSHNMSQSAEQQNDESLVVVRDRAIAETYYRAFREIFDHPQTLGAARDEAGLPALAITEVLPAADPESPHFVEIANLGDSPAPLAGLELWNRRRAVSLGKNAPELSPGAVAVVSFGDAKRLGVAEGAAVVELDPGEAPFVLPGAALVLRQEGGRWLSTFDPYAAAQNLPEGVRPAGPGVAWELGLSRRDLDALRVELLGVNETPEAEAPTWNPPGFFSDWMDEFVVTPAGLVLMQSMKAPLLPAADPKGSPGKI